MQKRSIQLSILIAISLLIIVPIAGAFEISPQSPNVGDKITITGTSTADKAPAEVIFVKTVPVEDGNYVYFIDDVVIPDGANKFIVRANDVEDLEVKVKAVFWLTAAHPSANNGIASYTMSNVPSGTYDIKLKGAANTNSNTVDLKISATSEITVNNGQYSYEYSTSSMPEGEFILKIDGETKVISLGTGTSSSSSSSSSSGSSGGSGSGAIGVSPDKAINNVLDTEAINLRVVSGIPSEHYFENSKNPITYINFTSGVTSRSVPITIEVLKGTSEIVKDEPKGTVYRDLNIWLGFEGFSTPENIMDAILNFEVDTTWIEENGIDPKRVQLMHYNTETDKWEPVVTKLIEIRDGIAYYKANPECFSPFSIVGTKDKQTQMNVDVNDETPTNSEEINDHEHLPFKTTSYGNVLLVTFPIILGLIYLIGRKIRN